MLVIRENKLANTANNVSWSKLETKLTEPTK